MRKIIVLIFFFINLTPLLSQNFVFVKGGFFIMGDTFGDGDKDAKPVRLVFTKDFFISKYEVTFEEFDEFVKDSNYKIGSGVHVFENNIWEFRENANYTNLFLKQEKRSPATAINFYDAIYFCNWKSYKEKLEICYTFNGKNVICNFGKNGYRLPTEAEWEFAARGGNKNSQKEFRYSGSNYLDEVAWYRNNSHYSTHEVGLKKSNSLNLYDMSGNVWEFCFDWFYDYKNSICFNPKGNQTGEFKIVRGGSFYDDCKHAVQVSNRFYIKPDDRFYNVGFRLAKSAN